MKLFELLECISDRKISVGCSDVDIMSIAQDTRMITPGSLFVCIVGGRNDGHKFAQAAIDNGAVAVVCQRSVGHENEIIVEDTRKAYSLLCRKFWGNPNDSIKLIAVTGTNGKTTVSSLIKQIIEKSGHDTGLIGTIKNEVAGVEIPSKFTTPDPFELFALLYRAVKAGCGYVIMEASSQALDQLRLYGLNFTVGVFTNLTQDHLDYHGTIENYFIAKASLFNSVETAVINFDDEYGLRIAENFKGKTLGFSIKNADAEYRAKNLKLSASGAAFTYTVSERDNDCFVPMMGEFSVYNALAAAAAADALGISVETVIDTLSHSKGVKGRSELLYAKEYSIICDYAHTADGLYSFLGSIKPFVEGRLIVLFGCAGERDAKKRPGMAEAVIAYSDIAVITSDNPRGEDANDIIEQITPVFDSLNSKYIAEVDRRHAIFIALSMLKKGDVLALCGKGHEDYQVIDGITLYFDEHRIVEEFTKEVSVGKNKA